MRDHAEVLLAATRLDPGDAEVARLARLLAADEHERAARFAFERDRRRFVVARGRLREWLAGATGVAPETLSFSYGAQGKPRLAGGGGPHFNLSHSGERALYGLSWHAPLGVDVELVRALDDPQAIGRGVFSPRELEVLAHAAPTARLSTFLATWTRKEAVIKATGLGVSQALERFSVLAAGDGRLVLEGDPAQGGPADWWLADVALEPGYLAAVAVIAPDARPSAVAWLGVA